MVQSALKEVIGKCSTFKKVLKEDLAEFGPDFINDLRLPVNDRYLAERILLGFIRAIPVEKIEDRQRLSDAMKALFNVSLQDAPQAKDDKLAISLMAQWYVMDRWERKNKMSKRNVFRSVAELARSASVWAQDYNKLSPNESDHKIENHRKSICKRLERAFARAQKNNLLDDPFDDKIIEVGVLQDLFLKELEERLCLFGVRFVADSA